MHCMLYATNASAGAEVALAIMVILLVIFAVVLSIASLVFWILMLVDCAKRKRMSDGERVAWILIQVFLGVIGSVAYYFAVKRG